MVFLPPEWEEAPSRKGDSDLDLDPYEVKLLSPRGFSCFGSTGASVLRNMAKMNGYLSNLAFHLSASQVLHLSLMKVVASPRPETEAYKDD